MNIQHALDNYDSALNILAAGVAYATAHHINIPAACKPISVLMNNKEQAEWALRTYGDIDLLSAELEELAEKRAKDLAEMNSKIDEDDAYQEELHVLERAYAYVSVVDIIERA